MKKLLLLASAALLTTGSMMATTWAVVGAYSDPSWNFGASTVLTGEGDNLSCTIDHLIGDFKIVDIDVSDWAVQYGTATPIKLGETYVLDAKNGGPDPANIKFDKGVLAVNNALVKWNPSNAELTITGDAEIGLPTLYMTGSFTSWDAPGSGNTVVGTIEGMVYTFKDVNLGDSGNVEFKLAGEGWSNEIAGGFEVGYDPVETTLGGDNLKTTLTGVQTLVFNYDTMMMNFVKPSTGAVESIDVNNAPAVYYNLQGVRVNNPQKGGLYIIKQGDKTVKSIVR